MAINMVSSLDGKVSVEGRANVLGGPADRRAMRNLRSGFDAILRGAATLRAEKISAGVPEPLAALRVSRGLPAQPREAIITKTGEVSLKTNLLNFAPDRTMIITPEAALDNPAFARLSPLAVLFGAPENPDGDVALPETLRLLKKDCGLDRILVEGGPTLNQALISDSLVDELFLTLAPKLVGGRPPDSQTLLDSVAPLPKNLEHHAQLRSVHIAGGELFLRYALTPLDS